MIAQNKTRDYLVFAFVLVIFLLFVIPVFSVVNIASTTLVSSGDDVYIISGVTETLYFNIYNTGTDNITAINITLPLGFNLVNTTTTAGWNVSNTTNAGMAKVVYNTTTGSGISTGNNKTFEIEIALNTTPPVDGSHNFVIVAKDNAANTAAKNIGMLVDNTAPVVNIEYPHNNTNILDDYLDVIFNITDALSQSFSCSYAVNGNTIPFDTNEPVTIQKTII